MQIGEQVEYLLQRQHELQSRRDELRQVVETDKRAPKADWSGIFDWDDRATTQLRDVFKLQSFRYQVAECAESNPVQDSREDSMAY